jgi:hypothetical protein
MKIHIDDIETAPATDVATLLIQEWWQTWPHDILPFMAAEEEGDVWAHDNEAAWDKVGEDDLPDGINKTQALRIMRDRTEGHPPSEIYEANEGVWNRPLIVEED